jgi:ribosomal-protein-alanine N-acetyltransferase
MLLDSPNISYSPITSEDRNLSLVMWQNAKVMNFIKGRALTPLEAETRFEEQLSFNAKNPNLGFIKAKLKVNNEIIGYLKMVKMEPGVLEIGYALLPNYWGKGLASEILKAMMAYALNLSDFHTLVGVVDTSNFASIKVLIKQTFTLDKEFLRDGAKVAHYFKKNK